MSSFLALLFQLPTQHRITIMWTYDGDKVKEYAGSSAFRAWLATWQNFESVDGLLAFSHPFAVPSV